MTTTLVPRGPAAAIVLDDLASALDADAGARSGFDALSFTHRKEYARWIDEAKRQETRDRRLAQALERLREGKPVR